MGIHNTLSTDTSLYTALYMYIISVYKRRVYNKISKYRFSVFVVWLLSANFLRFLKKKPLCQRNKTMKKLSKSLFKVSVHRLNVFIPPSHSCITLLKHKVRVLPDSKDSQTFSVSSARCRHP